MWAPIAKLVGLIMGRLLGIHMAKFLAQKVLWTGILTVGLPIILYQLFNKITLEIMDYSLNKMGASIGETPTLVQLSGMAAWIADQINLPSAISIFLGACATRAYLQLIRIKK